MPTFVYLPGEDGWLNVDQIVAAVRRPDDKAILLYLTGDQSDDPSFALEGPDREVFLKALSKLTPKELT